MDDEEFRYFCTHAGEIMVSTRTLNLVNKRCKELGIMKDNFDGGLSVK